VSSEEFNAFLNGPLSHPMPMMRLNRLAIALRCVVDDTGEAGEKALREHCRLRAEKDRKDLEDCG